jgi:cytochrome P450
MNINAGSDTVASTLRAIFYYLLKHPSTLSKLLTELSAARSSDRLTLPLPTWPETQHLPYLSAVIKEGLRLHPALGLPLERVVPASGLQLEDEHKAFLPPGTIVGVNPWIVHRDTRIFGEDAENWNPDRWVGHDVEGVKRMDQHILTFGAGKRTCLGKNIAMLEIHKLVPAMLIRYDFSLAEPEEEWRIRNSWIVRQEGVNVVLSSRNEVDKTAKE